MVFIWKPTKFYGGVAKLLNKESAKSIISDLGKKYKINTDVGFKTPGYKYLKFIRQDDLETLRSYPHMVTANYGINPIWCLWLTTINGIHYSLYINMVTEQVIWSKHRFSPKLYSGTLFEGEIINDKFMIWDVLINKGKNITHLNFHQRHDIARGIFNFQYMIDPVIENFPIEPKTFISYEHIKSFVNDVLSKDKNNQGLLFFPVKRSVKCYSLIFTANHNIDNLPNFLNELESEDLNPQKVIWSKSDYPSNSEQMVQEFWICPVNDICDNYYLHKISKDDSNLQIRRLDLVVVRSKERSLDLQSIFSNNIGVTKGGIRNLLKFECHYVTNFRKWEPIKLV